jgi:hypothetical protein
VSSNIIVGVLSAGVAFAALLAAPAGWSGQVVVAAGLAIVVLGRNRMFPALALGSAVGAAAGLGPVVGWPLALAGAALTACLALVLLAPAMRLGPHGQAMTFGPSYGLPELESVLAGAASRWAARRRGS